MILSKLLSPVLAAIELELSISISIDARPVEAVILYAAFSFLIIVLELVEALIEFDPNHF